MQPQAVSPAGDELLQDIIPGILVSLFASRRPRGGGQPSQTHPGLENQQEPPHCNPSPDSSRFEVDPKARAVAGRCSAVTQRVELFVINAPLFWQGESCLFFLPLGSSSPRSGHRAPTRTPAEQPQPHNAVFFLISEDKAWGAGEQSPSAACQHLRDVGGFSCFSLFRGARAARWSQQSKSDRSG